LNNRIIIDSIRNILINLYCYIKIEDQTFGNIRQSTSELVYEISQKFFDFPNLMTFMSIRSNDFEKNFEENLIFSIIITLFKDDHLLQERNSKKNVILYFIFYLIIFIIYMSNFT